MPKPSFSVIAVTLMTIGVFVLGDESGAQRNPAPSKAGTRLITLGTASGPIPRAGRAQSSNLLTVNGAHYVVDAGDGIARRLVKARIDVRDVGIIFITHHHDDHTAGLGTLMSSAWEQNRTKAINQCVRPTPDRSAREGRGAVFQHQRPDQDC